jgi:ubiquinone/menaquinone biosynthesis C-methylase UbiE
MDPRERITALFDLVAPVYDNVGVDYFRPIAEGLVQQMQPRNGERALDIGCGRGAALIPLGSGVLPDGHVTGIDLSPGMVDLCRKVAADAGVTADIRIGDAQSPNLPRAAYDVVTSSLVIFFLPDPAGALVAWRELLADGGRLGISTFGDYSPHWEAVESVFTPHIPPEMRDPRTTGKKGPFTTDETVEELFRDAGFTDVRTAHAQFQVRFTDKDQWYDWSRSVGLRAIWESIPDDQREGIREQAYEALEVTRDADGRMGFDQDVRYTVGRL